MKKLAFALLFMGFIALPFSSYALSNSGSGGGGSSAALRATIEVKELQAQINSLMAQLKVLQEKLGMGFGLVPIVKATPVKSVDLDNDSSDDSSDDADDSDDDSDDSDDDNDSDSDDADDDSDDDSNQSQGTRPFIKMVSSEVGEYTTYPGAKLVIQGHNLMSDSGSVGETVVYFGGQRVQVVGKGNGQLVIMTPEVRNSRYHVYVTNNRGTSNQVIVKVSKSQAPELFVSVPRAGATWEKGKTYTVKWRNTGRELATKTIYMVGTTGAERGMRKLLGTVTDADQFDFTVPSTMSAQTYTLWVCGETCPFSYGGGIGGNARVIVVESTEPSTSNTR